MAIRFRSYDWTSCLHRKAPFFEQYLEIWLGTPVYCDAVFLRHAASHQFVKDITEIREIEGKWDSLCSHAFRAAREDDVRDFFKLLSAKLGDAAVEQVVLHKDDKGDICFSRNYLTLERKVSIMYAHLPREKRYEIQQKLLATFINNHDQLKHRKLLEKSLKR